MNWKTTLAGFVSMVLSAASAHAQPARTEHAEPASSRPNTALRVARLANVLTNGLQAGWFLGTKLQVSPVREDLDGSDWIRFQGNFNRTIGPIAPFVMVSTAGANALPLLLDRDFRKVSFWINAAGFVLNVACIVTTVIGNVPVNDVTSTADPNQPPANWRELRSQWESFHTLRTVMSTTAFALNTTALAIDF